MCRKSAFELAQLYPMLSKLDIRLIAVGTGNPKSIKPFQEDTGFSSDIWIDSTAKLYKFFSCRRGIRAGLMNARTVEATKLAWAQGYRMAGLDGHLFQLGGVFVLYNGEIVWEHHDSFAGDVPDYPHLLAACGVPRELYSDLKFVTPLDLNPSLSKDEAHDPGSARSTEVPLQRSSSKRSDSGSDSPTARTSRSNSSNGSKASQIIVRNKDDLKLSGHEKRSGHQKSKEKESDSTE